MLETESLLLNPVIGKTYTEEQGKYKEYSRVTIKKFRIYYQAIEDHVIVVAVFFPGEM